MPPIEEDVILLTSSRSHFDSPKIKQLSRLSRWTRLKSWIRQHFRKHTHAWWTWEIASAMVSLTAMMILVIVLAQADQHKQPSWAVAGTQLTLNTVVAAVGTVIRTSLYIVVAGALNQSAWNWFAVTNTMNETQSYGRPLKDLETFGEAAANSWSCLKLLCRTRCRYLISIGAVVMILSIGFDTFLQQVLSTEQRTFSIKQDSRNLTAENIIPRFQTVNVTNSFSPDNSTQDVELQDLQNTWLIYGNSNTNPVSCPTGNCVWPVTPTMAICSECGYAVPTVHHSSDNSCANITTYSLPNSCYPYNVTVLDCGASKQTSWRFDSVYPECADLDDAISLQKSLPSDIVKAYLANIYLLGTDLDRDAGSNNYTISSLSSYKCTLSVCIQGFQASATAGRTTQTPIKAKAFDFQIGSNWNNSLYTAGEFINLPAELNAKTSDHFMLDRNMIGYLQLLASFPSGYSTKFIVNGTMGERAPSDLSTMVWDKRNSLDGISNLMENLANGLTSYLRSRSDLPADSYYAPIIGTLLPVVVVRWAWLSYPLFLQISGFAFLFLTMRATRHRRVLAWKGHRTTLLLATLDDSLRNQARGGLAHRTGLDDRVGETLVRLDFDGEDGIIFRRADHTSCKEARRTVSDAESSIASSQS